MYGRFGLGFRSRVRVRVKVSSPVEYPAAAHTVGILRDAEVVLVALPRRLAAVLHL